MTDGIETTPAPKARKGFAAMDDAQKRQIASQGGKRAHALGVAHEFDAEEARAAGSIGGRKVSANREHMREIGRRGGLKRQERARAKRAREAGHDGV